MCIGLTCHSGVSVEVLRRSYALTCQSLWSVHIVLIFNLLHSDKNFSVVKDKFKSLKCQVTERAEEKLGASAIEVIVRNNQWSSCASFVNCIHCRQKLGSYLS